MTSQTLTEWLDYIYTLHPREIDLGLERIDALAKSLSLTHFTCPIVTVAGTNGKGSIIKFLESIYLASGYRVAAYTSPHLLKFNERLRINGEEASDGDFLGAFEFIEKSRGEQELSFFEFTTLVVLHICQQKKLDVLLLEVGLGGRLDAVNIVDPTIAVISNIDIDHVDWLGPDRESIGKEKAGIIRAGIPVICGDDDPPKSLIHAAKNNPFFCFKKDYRVDVQSGKWNWVGPTITYLHLPMPQLKLANAATSLMVVEQLQSRLPVTQFGILAGIKKASLSGRFEIIQKALGVLPSRGGLSLSPRTIIYDVAHNPQSMAYLAEQLRRLPTQGRTLAVVGMLTDKDIGRSVAKLIPLVDQWYAGGLEVKRGAKAEQITSELTTQGVKNCYNFASVIEALERAISECWEQDRLLIFGSFYTVASVKQYFKAELE